MRKNLRYPERIFFFNCERAVHAFLKKIRTIDKFLKRGKNDHL